MNKAAVASMTMDEFKALPVDQRRNAVTSGKIRPPRLGSPERKEFDLQLGLRAASADSTPTPADSVPPTPAAATPAPAPAAPGAAEPSGTPAPAATPAPATPAPSAPAAPEKKYGGFASIDELIADHKKVSDQNTQHSKLLAEQQEIIRKINNTASDQGRTLATLKAELAEKTKQMDELAQKIAATSPAAAAAVDEIGEPPDPSAFEDGVLDTGFQSALHEHMKKLTTAYATVVKENRTLKDGLTKSQSTLDKVAGTVDSISKDSASNRAREAQSAFMADVEQFQKDYGLTLSVPFSEMNEQVLIANDEKADATLRASARSYLKALKPEDGVAFDKVCKAIHTRFDFSDGTPKARYRTWRGALADAEIIADYQPAAPQPAVDAEEEARLRKLKEQHDSPDVGALPADQGSVEKPLGQQGTPQDKARRIAELEKIRGQNPVTFRENKPQWEEYKALRAFFGRPVIRA